MSTSPANASSTPPTTGSAPQQQQQSSGNNGNSGHPMAKEVSHYVVTAHPPGGVLFTCRGHFTSPTSNDVVVAKSRCLELRTWQSNSSGSAAQGSKDDREEEEEAAAAAAEKASLFPVLASVPVHGRLTSLETLKMKHSAVDYIFCTTDRHQYAVLSYAPHNRPYPFQTHASGRLPGGNDDPSLLGRPSESGPLVAMDPKFRCIALHWLDGLVTVLPVDMSYNYSANNNHKKTDQTTAAHNNNDVPAYWPKPSWSTTNSCLKEPFHVRMEERTLLNMVFLDAPQEPLPQLTLLHQDSRGTQHIFTHAIDLRKQTFSSSAASTPTTNLLKRSRVDGGSSWMIPVVASRPLLATTAAAAAAAASAGDANNPGEITLGGVIVLGQRQITYANATTTKVVPVPPCLFLSWDVLPDDPKGMPRYLLADEFGNLHLLSFLTYHARIVALTLETLGSCALANTCTYLGDGLCFVGSTLGDSQLVQIHEEPIRQEAPTAQQQLQDDDPSASTANEEAPGDLEWMMDSTYLTVVEEYTHLGPIVDFDLVPTAPGLAGAAAGAGGSGQQQPSQVVTASGTSRAGSIRLIRNGIGMNEYASVEMPGIQAMWSVRAHYKDRQDAYLLQSFVGQTRVLGVVNNSTGSAAGAAEDADMPQDGGDDDDSEEVGGTLEEAMLEGLEANATSLYIGNVQAGDRLLQITEREVRLISLPQDHAGGGACGGGGGLVDTWSPPIEGGDRPITVAAGNEAGQAVVATHGGILWYLGVNSDGTKLESLEQKQMEREVSCLDVHPFAQSTFQSNPDGVEDMQIDQSMKTTKERPPCPKSAVVAVGLWDDFTVRLLSLNQKLEELHQIHLSTEDEEEDEDATALMSAEESAVARRHRNNMMARSLCLITLDTSSSSNSHHATSAGASGSGGSAQSGQGVNMMFVGLGDGTVVSFAVIVNDIDETRQSVIVQSKKEVCLGTQRINLIPLQTEWGGTCVLATGDRPTVIYLAGVASGTSGNAASFNPKLCYSNVNVQVSEEEEADHVSRPASQQTIAVNVAAPFFSSLLFDAGSLGSQYYSLCVADDSNLRLGVIDDIQKLHVTTCRLGMSPRRIVHCAEGRMFAVGCIESGIKQLGLGGEEQNMGNCIRFLDDTAFDDIERIDLEPYEMILSMTYASMRVHSAASTSDAKGVKTGKQAGESSGDATYRTYLLVGTAYAIPDEDEPTRGRIMVIACGSDGSEDEAATTSNSNRAVRQVTELQVRGGVYSMCQFYEGKVLATVNSKTHICQLTDEGNVGGMKLSFVGVGHHGHILTLFVKSQAGRMPTQSISSEGASSGTVGQAPTATGASTSMPMDVDHQNKKKAAPVEKEKLAIVGDLMRSISVVQYYPEHETLEEIARDFNTNWTTAIEMLTDDVYLGAENWNNLFVLRRNTKSQSEEVRCRLDTIGEFHLGEMCNKFMKGSLVMPHSSSSSNNARNSSRRSGAVTSPIKKKSSDGTPSKAGGQGGAAARIRRPAVTIGSQTLFGTVDGTLGCILGLDVRTAAFFSTLERAMTKVIRPVGDFSHQQFRAFDAERRMHPAHGFVDGDLVESFLDLDRSTMEAVVHEMNRDGGWEIDRGGISGSGGQAVNAPAGGEKVDTSVDVDPNEYPELVVEDVVALVEEMAMLH